MALASGTDKRLTVRHLTEYAELHCRIISGEAGADRRISWAHQNELVDPTPWLSGGELLMTTGMAIPSPPSAQVAYLERLAERGVAGLAIGDRRLLEDLDLSDLSPEFYAAADRLALPIVLVSGRTPFIAIAQHVAAASQDTVQSRMARHLRVYQTLAESLAVRRSGCPSASAVSPRFPATSCRSSRRWASRSTRIAQPAFPVGLPDIADALATEDYASRVPQPLPDSGHGDRRVFVVPVLANQRPVGVLVAVSNQGSDDDRLILHHIATIVSLLVADLFRERERERREGGELLARALADAERGQSRTIADAFPGRPTERVAFAVVDIGKDATGWSELHHRLNEHGFAHRMTRRSDRGAVLAALGDQDVGDLEAVLATHLPTATVGLSAPVAPGADLAIVRREARWALRCAAYDGLRAQSYASTAQPSWLMLEASGMEQIVDDVLGALIAHDEQTGAELEQTLRVFLECNRSWKAASEQLFIHRQTLIARVKRIEQLTGRRLDRTDDVCDLWLSIKARRALTLAGAADD
ncbi:MAG: PucR family transcriptional regulator ligand-binding domain-containing protein [Solirubrobacterales bacterium]